MVASKNGTTEKALMHFSQNQKLESLTTSAIKKQRIDQNSFLIIKLNFQLK